MKTKILWIVFLVSIFGFTGCGDEGGNGGGPEISSITAYPSTVEVNGTSTLTCVASHPEGYPLEYIWVATGGAAISGSGNSVTWIAPGSSGLSTVICKVVDIYGKQDTADVTIKVEKPGEDEEDDPIKVLVDTTVSLSLINGYFHKNTFVAEIGKPVTITATGTSNMKLDLEVRDDSTNNILTEDNDWGSVTTTFTPINTDVYSFTIRDFQHVGGAVHIVVIQ